MGIYTRADSPWWWLYLESTKEKIKTDIRIGITTQQRHDAERLARDLYFQEMNARSARAHRLPHASRAIRFAAYAEPYATDTIAHRKGARRELELLANLRAFFDRDLLTVINDRDRVKAYHTARLAAGAGARTINREIDLLKVMIRDAVPKYLAHSELAGMPQFPVAPIRRRLMTHQEERRLLAVCEDPQDTALIVLGLDTLIRLGDLLDLRRDDWRRHWIDVRDPKTADSAGDRALSPRAVAALKAIPDEGPYFFTKFRQAQPQYWGTVVRARFKLLCGKARILYGRKVGGLTFHWATRRTGATRMLVDRRVRLPTVQAQGGWKRPEILLEIYSEAQRKDLLAAVGQTVKHRSRLLRLGGTR